MIIPDVNLLVYAYNEAAPNHAQAKRWWESLMSNHEPVGIAWVVALGLVRLMSHPKVVVAPVSHEKLLAHVRSWLGRPHVALITPGARHLDLLGVLLTQAPGSVNVTTDAHLAALAIESQSELHSNDNDFARFSGLRWRNPL